MWRVAVSLFLLSPSYVYAGEARGVLRVGITISGPSNSSTITKKSATSTTNTTAISSAQPAMKTKTGSFIVPSNTVPATQ